MEDYNFVTHNQCCRARMASKIIKNYNKKNPENYVDVASILQKNNTMVTNVEQTQMSAESPFQFSRRCDLTTLVSLDVKSNVCRNENLKLSYRIDQFTTNALIPDVCYLIAEYATKPICQVFLESNGLIFWTADVFSFPFFYPTEPIPMLSLIYSTVFAGVTDNPGINPQIYTLNRRDILVQNRQKMYIKEIEIKQYKIFIYKGLVLS
jgi:hypothetical protein